MKKTGYLVIGLLAGSILSTAAGTVTAQVKSLIGAKVAAEYTVTVDGKQLADKAVIVDNKAMVPLRSVSDSLGAEIKVDSKSKQIDIATSSEDNTVPSDIQNTNKYEGKSKAELQQLLSTYKDKMLTSLASERASILAQIETIQKSIDATPEEMRDTRSLDAKKTQLAEYDQMIKDAEAEIELIKSALASFND